MILQIDSSILTVQSQGIIFGEADEMGLDPNEWPETLEMDYQDDGEHVSYTRVNPITSDQSDEPVGMTYRTEDGIILHIFNSDFFDRPEVKS